jgi:hypothetical protein
MVTHSFSLPQRTKGEADDQAAGLFDKKQNGKNNSRKNKTAQGKIPECAFMNGHGSFLI